ncbi:MAG: LamG domain-containing protein [Ignavibacteria bacterium]|nr:LamG domain-containing protein [Ignavibacteria bacterium]
MGINTSKDLTNKTPSNSYKDLVHFGNNNQGLSDSTLVRLSDGRGNELPILIRKDKVVVKPTDSNGDILVIEDLSGNTLLTVDAVNKRITAGTGVKFVGDGSLLSGITGATGGVSNTGSTNIVADSDANGSGDITFSIGSTEIARIVNNGSGTGGGWLIKSLTVLPTPAGNDFVLGNKSKTPTVKTADSEKRIQLIEDNNSGDVSGYWFDGVDDYVQVADNDNLDFGTGNFSLEVYFKTGVNIPSGSLVLLDKSDYFNNGYSLFYNQTYFRFNIDDGTTYSLISTQVPQPNKLYHLVAVKSGNIIFLYINGILEGTLNCPNNTISNSYPLQFNRTGTGTALGNHKLFFARLYNRALTQSEVIELYNNGNPLAYVLPYADRRASQNGLVTGDNSTFDSDTGFWYKGTGWSISGGKAIANYVNITVLSANILQVGKRYRVKFTIGDYSGSGDCGISTDRFTNITMIQGSDIRASGNGTIEFIGEALTTALDFYGRTTNYFTIDNVECYQVGSVAEYLPQNAGAMGWLESQNGLHGTTYGNPIALAGYRDYKSGISITTVQLVNTQKANHNLKQVIVKNNYAGTNTIYLGTTTNANELINGVNIGDGETKVIDVNSFTTSTRSLYVKAGNSNIDIILVYDKIM